MRRRRVLWVVSVALTLTGCSTTVLVGTPAETVLTKADLYNPCTLPVSALTAIGVDPKPIDTDFMGVEDPKWHLCDWEAESFFITVLSTTHTFQEVKENPQNDGFRTVNVEGRNAAVFGAVSDKARDVCDIAFATQAGVIIVRAQANPSKPKQQDPCVVAQESAISLSKNFPQ